VFPSTVRRLKQRLSNREFDTPQRERNSLKERNHLNEMAAGSREIARHFDAGRETCLVLVLVNTASN
jgi:hypothetical protein